MIMNQITEQQMDNSQIQFENQLSNWLKNQVNTGKNAALILTILNGKPNAQVKILQADGITLTNLLKTQNLKALQKVCQSSDLHAYANMLTNILNDKKLTEKRLDSLKNMRTANAFLNTGLLQQAILQAKKDNKPVTLPEYLRVEKAKPQAQPKQDETATLPAIMERAGQLDFEGKKHLLNWLQQSLLAEQQTNAPAKARRAKATAST